MRLLTCQRCHEIVGVHEVPVEFYDPDAYVCGQCLEPINGQLEIGDDERVETVAYDPDRSMWPAGF